MNRFVLALLLGLFALGDGDIALCVGFFVFAFGPCLLLVRHPRMCFRAVAFGFCNQPVRIGTARLHRRGGEAGEQTGCDEE